MLTLPSQRALAELPEKRLDVADEEIGHFHRGEVPAAIELRPNAIDGDSPCSLFLHKEL